MQSKCYDKKIIVLIGIIAILAAYSLSRIVGDYLTERDAAAFRSGVEEGIRQAVDTVFSEIQSKGFVSVFNGNQTLTLIPVPQPLDQSGQTAG
jgi:type II secretory pathway pseudopilin PulG